MKYMKNQFNWKYIQLYFIELPTNKKGYRIYFFKL